MKRMKQQLLVLQRVAHVTYVEWSAYRTHSMVSILVGPVYFLVQYYIWTAVYGDGGAIHGMELSEMITYFGVTTLIGYLTMDFADWNLNMLVRTGKYLTFALRPVHHRYFALAQKLGHRVLGFFFEFLPCLLVFWLLFGLKLIPKSAGWFVLAVALSFLLTFYVHYILGLLSFWLVETNGIRSAFALLAAVFSGSLIPLVFFPKGLQILQFFLPFQYMTYVPAMVFTGNQTLAGVNFAPGEIVGIEAIYLIFTMILSELLYRLSMKRFTGVGA